MCLGQGVRCSVRHRCLFIPTQLCAWMEVRKQEGREEVADAGEVPREEGHALRVHDGR